MKTLILLVTMVLGGTTLYGASTTPVLIHSVSRKAVAPFNALKYNRAENVYDGQYYVGNPDHLSVVTVEDYDDEKIIPTDGTVVIVSEATLAEALAETQAVIDALTDAIWTIADAYGVTNSPLDWFTLDAAIEVSASSTNELTAMQALRAGVRLDKNALFLKEWGVNLFNITR